MDTLTPEERSHLMSLVRAKDTKPEMRVRRLVHALGYRYLLHDRTLPGSPDLVFPGRRKVIFVHGCFWHRHNCAMGNRMPKSRVRFWKQKLESNRRRDQRHRRALNRAGWRALTVWECQTQPKKLDLLTKRIQRFLSA